MQISLNALRHWYAETWHQPRLQLGQTVSAVATRIFTSIRLAFYSLRYSREEYLKKEYEVIKSLDEPCNKEHFIAAEQNSHRNRYSNILPNEPTRVKDKKQSDWYFNANWVLGKKAIACQGPLSIELSQFWEMVSKNKAQVIVTLANPVENERQKTSDYWSTCNRETQFLKNSDNTTFKHRHLTQIDVHQFHLENWPDHGVVAPETLAYLIKRVSDKAKELEGPILVHCSAGIGRTGTFLAAYEAFTTKNKDIFSIAKALRSPYTGRVGMIQTPEQYKLVHDTVDVLFST